MAILYHYSCTSASCEHDFTLNKFNYSTFVLPSIPIQKKSQFRVRWKTQKQKGTSSSTEYHMLEAEPRNLQSQMQEHICYTHNTYKQTRTLPFPWLNLSWGGGETWDIPPPPFQSCFSLLKNFHNQNEILLTIHVHNISTFNWMVEVPLECHRINLRVSILPNFPGAGSPSGDLIKHAPPPPLSQCKILYEPLLSICYKEGENIHLTSSNMQLPTQGHNRYENTQEQRWLQSKR